MDNHEFIYDNERCILYCHNINRVSFPAFERDKYYYCPFCAKELKEAKIDE